MNTSRREFLSRVVHPNTQLIACGSSNTILPTCRPAPFLDVVAVFNPLNAQVCLRVLNGDLDSEGGLVLDWRDATPGGVLACETRTGTDLKATHTFEPPRQVAPRALEAPRAGARMTFKRPARSYTVAQLTTS
jgi:hypothetical protein